LASKSTIIDTTNIIIFVTDGYHSQRDEIPELIENFTKSGPEYNNNFYSIGLGISGDYDHELMSKLFINFAGCPDAESVSDNIIQSAFAGTSTILKFVKINFSDNVTDIKTSLSMTDGNYVVDKLDLSTKIPFYFKMSNDSPGFIIISGVNTTGTTVTYSFSLGENLFEASNVNLFKKYFELEKEYLSIIENSESQVACKLQLEALNLIISDIIKTQHLILDELSPFYSNLKTKITNFITNINGVHVTQLDDNEFKHWLHLGSVAIRHASSNVVVPNLSRQTSVKMTETINRSQSVYTDDQSLIQPVPLKRDTNLRQLSAPLPRPPKPILRHMLSTISEESMCKICYSNPIQVMSLPCKHVTSCIECIRHMNVCPICRIKVESGKELKIRGNCYRCKSNIPNILFLPCSHVIVCEDCVTKKESTLCNKCGQSFSSYCKLYV
jgi:hypothetical protein